MTVHIQDTTAPDSSAADVIAKLERRLAASEKVNAVLMDRLERRQAGEISSFSVIEQNITLEKIVSRKTRELEAERAELSKALDDLRAAQARLLQAQKMESIGQLAAGMAHEINTPIQYVTDNINFVRRCFLPVVQAAEMGSATIAEWRARTLDVARIAEIEAALGRLRIDYLKKNVPAALEQSLEGLQRVASIVAAMKNFSHPSTGVKEPVDLRAIIEDATTVARNEWKYVADLSIEIEPGLPNVPCLRDEFGQVVLNLVVNAAHAIGEAQAARGAEAGKGHIVVGARRCGESVEVSVADDGTGIPPANRDRIFDPFFTTKPVGRGTGQGLAICYSTVVDKHGGQIAFDTEPGRGTTFRVRLPLAPAAEPVSSCA